MWLFKEVTDLGRGMEYLIVSLTPSFKNNVWYEKIPSENKLLIHGEKEGEVSYRLIANRHDWQDWPNETE